MAGLSDNLTPCHAPLGDTLPIRQELSMSPSTLTFEMEEIMIVRAQLIQLLRGLVTNSFEPENSRS
jgi:hypothetical protein